MIRSMEYAYPGCGYERTNDRFIGRNILVALVVEKGARARRVIFPQGAWQDEAGRRYEGPIEAVLEALLEKLLCSDKHKLFPLEDEPHPSTDFVDNLFLNIILKYACYTSNISKETEWKFRSSCGSCSPF